MRILIEVEVENLQGECEANTLHAKIRRILKSKIIKLNNGAVRVVSIEKVRYDDGSISDD